MAESVFSDMLRKRGAQGIVVSSAAAHTGELGNPPHRGTRERLARAGIPLVPHRARLMTKEDGEEYDLIIGMDAENIRDMKRVVGKKNEEKVKMLLDYTASPRSVADPWYTGDFDKTYDDIVEGCSALLERLCGKD